MLVLVAKEASVVVGESEANKGKTTCLSIELARVCRLMSAKGFSNVTIGYRQSRHWHRGDRVCPSRSVVIGARLLAAGRATPQTIVPRFLFFCFFVVVWWRAVDGVCALLGVVCAAGCCVRFARRRVRGSTLCALGAVCAARALLNIFVCMQPQRDTDVVYLLPANLARRCRGSSDERGRR